jgi:hypothetical protein
MRVDDPTDFDDAAYIVSRSALRVKQPALGNQGSRRPLETQRQPLFIAVRARFENSNSCAARLLITCPELP